jgi:prefoldin beta subunit
MDLLVPESKVFKLVGPVLLSVDLEDAKQNVQKRIEFIEKELKKVEEVIGEHYFIQ